MSHYRDLWWYPDETLATNARAAIFPEGSNVYASIFSDAGLTVPLANPTTTDGSGYLDFYVTDGEYRIWVGPTTGGDGELVTVGAVVSGTVISVNGQTGIVVLTAADVGADPAGSAAAAAAASQPLATIDAKGDLYAGTADNATTRLAVGSNGQILSANSATGTGLQWIAAPSAPVTSVNGQTGVVVLTATDVGADPVGSAAAAAAASQPLATINAKGDLYAGTANDTTTRLAVGTNNQVLRANSATGTGLEYATLSASDVGAVPTTRQVLTQNGLTGGGDLSADRTLEPVYGSSANTVAQGNDTRIVNAIQGTIVDAKGDVITATANDTPARLAVGADGTVLTAASGQATGLQWVAPTAGISPTIFAAKGDLLGASANDTPAIVTVGTDGQYLRAASGQTTGVEYHTIVASDVGAVPTTRTITTQNGLTGGGDLSANRTFEPVYGTAVNTVAQGNDSRIVNAIQGTLMDAKGDIIAASANDTPVRVAVGTDGQVLAASSGSTPGVAWANRASETLVFYDDRATLTVVSGDARFYNRQGALIIVGAWASAGVVPTGADIIVDINVNGTTIFSTQGNRPTVPATTNGGTLSATPNTTAFAVGDYMTVDIDQIGSTIAGGRLTVGIVVRPG